MEAVDQWANGAANYQPTDRPTDQPLAGPWTEWVTLVHKQCPSLHPSAPLGSQQLLIADRC